jgi:hypothetical protein
MFRAISFSSIQEDAQMRAQFWRSSVFFLLMLTVSLASFAQIDVARLQGTVTDPQATPQPARPC